MIERQKKDRSHLKRQSHHCPKIGSTSPIIREGGPPGAPRNPASSVCSFQSLVLPFLCPTVCPLFCNFHTSSTLSNLNTEQQRWESQSVPLGFQSSLVPTSTERTGVYSLVGAFSKNSETRQDSGGHTELWPQDSGRRRAANEWTHRTDSDASAGRQQSESFALLCSTHSPLDVFVAVQHMF